MRILIVDDYIPVMALFAAVLDDDPAHEVDTATDGREALRKVAAMGYDLVVMNLRLRETDGPECLSAIRKLRPRQRVLVLVDALDEETAAALRASGVRPDAVVVGTRDRKTLVQRIGAALKGPGTQADPEPGNGSAL
ncbi:MAG: response regulator transcription factor [Candidatus Latescibacteria bacterium]|nr:response regulator transcription factor [Candidatus Latescibacterota bacterium]